MSRPAWMPEGQDYRWNVLFRDGSRLHGLTEAELAQHDGHISQVWRVPVWPAAGVSVTGHQVSSDDTPMGTPKC